MSENTTLAHDLIDALDAEPELTDELRRRILTDELLALPEKVDQLASTVGQLASTVADGFVAVNTRLESLEGRLNTLDGRVANITGSDYERRATRRVPSLLSRYLRLSRIQALHSPLQETAPFLVEMINNALTAHDITDSEANDLEEADIIVSANNAAGDSTYLVAEVSITIHDHDVDRARERADILAKVAVAEVRAAVIGTDISEANRERAESSNVGVLMFERLERDLGC